MVVHTDLGFFFLRVNINWNDTYELLNILCARKTKFDRLYSCIVVFHLTVH